MMIGEVVSRGGVSESVAKAGVESLSHMECGQAEDAMN